MSDGTTTWTYTYDADGMRTSRTNGTDTYTYVYNGSLLSQMTRNGRDMFFTYDAMGMPATLTYRGIVFFYVTNLQGDVMALMDEEGNIVVEYLYDAWGNLLSTTGAMANTLGIWNPLTYRGYVYDHELEMYYLQSRYYDPMVGRFLNADIYVATGQGLVGNNMFAYCNNNPINMVDYTGKQGKWIELWGGRYYRIDPANTSTCTKRHIHITNFKKEYIQNEDGSPHDQGRGQKGKLSSTVNKKLKKKIGWDYNGKRESFFDQTIVSCSAEGLITYTFADGTLSYQYFSPWRINTYSINSLETAYYSSGTSSSSAAYNPLTIYVPFLFPVSLPDLVFDFGSAWFWIGAVAKG